MALYRGCWFLAIVLLLLTKLTLAAEVEAVNRANLSQRVQHLERIVEGQGLSDLLLLVEQLQASVRRLQGKAEEIQHQLDSLENQQRELYQDLDRRLQQLSQANLAPSPIEETTGDITTTTAFVAADPGEKAYQAALELLKERRYKKAITAFNQFLQQYPSSRYRPSAQYWLAETQYVLRNFEAAARTFQALAEQYPESARVPDAMLKQGLAYYELKQWEQAKAKFQEVIARFPDSTVSRLAGERLDKMKRESHI